MKIAFTLNHLDAFALNESRLDEFYSLARSYNGIGLGQEWSKYDALDWLLGENLIVNTDEDGTQWVSMRQVRFDLVVLKHAFHVHFSSINFRHSLREVHQKTGESSLKELKMLIQHFKSMLERTEW